MDDSYISTSNGIALKPIKWFLILKLLRIKNPAALTAFLSLNPWFRAVLLRNISAKYKDPSTVSRRLGKAANLISVAFLYGATASNSSIPKDYVLLYLYQAYYGTLNPPSSSILISPTSKRFKLSSYPASSIVSKLYKNKHFVLFPLVYAQILSNYLTPTQYRLNHKHLSAAIKTYILNPIWINFTLSPTYTSLNLAGILKSYSLHHLALFLYCCLTSVKPVVLEYLHLITDDNSAFNFTEIFWKKLVDCFHTSNTVTNLIYIASLLSMATLTIPVPVNFLRNGILGIKGRKGLFGINGKIFHSFIDSNRKTILKNYIKLIGFILALLAMLVLSSKVLSGNSTSSGKNPRTISAKFYNMVNSYLIRLIILSKWRIVKENHPWFTVLKIGTWQRIETLAMCFIVWQIMNLNDYIGQNRFSQKRAECLRLQAEPLIRLVDRIM